MSDQTLPHSIKQSREQGFDAAVQQEKLTALKAWAYGASHEINNPLTNIATRAQSLLVEETHPERRRSLAMIASQAFRASEMIADMMLFVKPPPLEVREVDLRSLLRQVQDEISEDAHQQGTRLVEVEPEGGDSRACFARIDADQIAEMFRALVRNSLEAVRSGGEVRWSLRPTFARPMASDLHSYGQRFGETGQALFELVVQDTGPGIPQEIRSRIFDPFYSGREAGRGIGMGLAKCWRIIEEHGGVIRLVEDVASGAAFSVLLPSDVVIETKTPGSPAKSPRERR